MHKKNDLNLGKRIAVAVIFFAIFLLCIASVTIPPSNYYIEKAETQENDVLFTLKSQDILSANGCEVDASGKISPIGEDPNIVFAIDNADAKSVKLKFAQPLEEGFECVLYYDIETDFSEEKSVRSTAFAGDKYLCYNLPDEEITNIRFDIDYAYVLDSVEFHLNAITTEQQPLSVNHTRYIFVGVASILFLIVFYLFDLFVYPVSKKLLEFISKNIKTFLVHILAICAAIALAVPTEFVLAKFIFKNGSLNSLFNPYRFFFIACVFSCIAVLVLHIKDKAKETERLFVWLMVFAGIALILCAPFGHICWDYDSHSRFVLETSYIGDAYITGADRMTFLTEDFNPDRRFASENHALLAELNSKGNEVVGIQKGAETTIAHIPTGVAYAVFRFLGFPYVLSIMAARFANLLVYTFVVFLAIKKVSSGKMLLATIAFFPTNIFLATTLSYDFWTVAFFMLGTAYYIEELKNRENTTTVKDAVIMCGAFMLGCLPKQIYMPIMLLPFFVFKNWKDKKARNRYLAVCILMFVLMFGLLLLRSFGEVSKGGDMRGGSDVSVLGQAAFILNNPLKYVSILFNFLKDYLSISGMKGYTIFFAYLGYGALGRVYLELILVTALTDKDKKDSFRGMHFTRLLNVLMFFGVIILVATSLYLSYTPVGLETINGCQPRYIVPLMIPLLFTIFNPGISFDFDKRIYNTVIMSILAFSFYYNVYAVTLQRLL